MSRYDHIVIGAGIMGSSTALYLVKQGKKVLLLDQYPLPHTRGSSHGQSRVIRSCYSESYFAAMMPDAFAMWKEIEQETDSNLIIQTGSLFMGQSTTPEFSFSLSNMQRHSPQNLILLTTEEVVSRYPMIRYPYDYKVLLDKSGGIVLASKALAAVQNLFKQKGGHLWDGCPVSRIQPGDDVTIMTSRGYVIAPSVVICAGAWTTKLLKSLSVPKPPLQPKAVQVFYWKEKLPGQYSVAGGFPVFVDCTSKTRHAYGLPSLEYPGLVKEPRDTSIEQGPGQSSNKEEEKSSEIKYGQPCDPDEREKAAPNTEFQNVACEYVREHFPGLESKPSIVENCLYTVTPDECFIIDSLPMVGNIVIGCGFSGTGFKLAPVVGKLLSEVAQGLTPSHDLGPFRLARFTRGAFAEARYRSMTT